MVIEKSCTDCFSDYKTDDDPTFLGGDAGAGALYTSTKMAAGGCKLAGMDRGQLARREADETSAFRSYFLAEG